MPPEGESGFWRKPSTCPPGPGLRHHVPGLQPGHASSAQLLDGLAGAAHAEVLVWAPS